MTIKIGYFRVSKQDEKIQVLSPQIDAVISKFDLSYSLMIFPNFFDIFLNIGYFGVLEQQYRHLKYLVDSILYKIKSDNYIFMYVERGTAYDVDKIKDRTEFLKLMKVLFNIDHTTVEDLFLNNYEKRDVELYVWDYHRIMRNFKFSLLFWVFSDLFNVKVFSYKQDHIVFKEDEKPVDTFSRYIFYSINAFSSEDYSHNISENVKKSIHKEGDVTVSSKGNKWGSKFKDKDDKKKELSINEINKMNNKIYKLIRHYEKYNIKCYYKFIIANILKLYGVKLSKAYITVLRQKNKIKCPECGHMQRVYGNTKNPFCAVCYGNFSIKEKLYEKVKNGT